MSPFLLTVISPKAIHCRTPGAVIVSEPSGYLANSITEETRCGGDSTPWRIEGSPGQQVNLTLLDFHSDSKDSPHGDQTCHRYALVRERGTGRQINVCGGGTKGRLSHVYTSSSGALDITVFTPSQSATQAYFLLHFQGRLRGLLELNRGFYYMTGVCVSSTLIGR